MYVLSPLIPAWKAISISLKTPKSPCAVIQITGPNNQVALWKNCRLSWLKKPVMTNHGLHRSGDFRLSHPGNQFFLAACWCPAILVLALDFPALLAVNLHSPAPCHWDLPDTQQIKSVKDIPATSGLRHPYC